eukprot:Plantae.Rhodophyta-Rhodochaete_pulchella.ctg6031.p1 GENE.Plantae.Rhodophyta-Rhodochaete_pulchella.ctg6031~~Plantae.Rhodophyta-Rhodochaete_pulchella.ctg6031.p1  ORF type:complete len:497 (+),score=67.96 Plantae.Rhodophyta-Rhodochaete_pulchella.ctg6031:110-1600(+)
MDDFRAEAEHSDPVNPLEEVASPVAEELGSVSGRGTESSESSATLSSGSSSVSRERSEETNVVATGVVVRPNDEEIRSDGVDENDGGETSSSEGVDSANDRHGPVEANHGDSDSRDPPHSLSSDATRESVQASSNPAPEPEPEDKPKDFKSMLTAFESRGIEEMNYKRSYQGKSPGLSSGKAVVADGEENSQVPSENTHKDDNATVISESGNPDEKGESAGEDVVKEQKQTYDFGHVDTYEQQRNARDLEAVSVPVGLVPEEQDMIVCEDRLFQAHGVVHGIALAGPDKLITSDEDGWVKVWSLERKEMLAMFCPEDGCPVKEVHVLADSTDETLSLVTVGPSREMKVWLLRDGEATLVRSLRLPSSGDLIVSIPMLRGMMDQLLPPPEPPVHRTVTPVSGNGHSTDKVVDEAGDSSSGGHDDALSEETGDIEISDRETSGGERDERDVGSEADHGPNGSGLSDKDNSLLGDYISAETSNPLVSSQQTNSATAIVA